ncbi:MAG: hypothetical protein QXP42_01375 [Candidatus Micrarchaeia archaeon]
MRLLLCFFILWLAGFAFALSLSVNGELFRTGDVLIASTDAIGNATFMLYADGHNLMQRTVFSDDMIETNYTIKESDPSGMWRIVVVHGNETVEKNFTVARSPETAYYKVAFLSPPDRLVRTHCYNISVFVTDAGEPVGNALVFAFVPIGKISLSSLGEVGRYGGVFCVGHNASLGRHSVHVIALKRSGDVVLGGEGIKNITVERVALNVSTNFFGDAWLEERRMINITAKYENGEPVKIPYCMVKFGNRTIEECCFEHAFTEEGYFDAHAYVRDDAGNEGEVRFGFRVSKSIKQTFEENKQYILAVVGLMIGVVVLFLFVALPRIRRGKLKKRKEELVLLIKKLQEDYYEKCLLDRKTFEKMSSQYERELEDINRRLEGR